VEEDALGGHDPYSSSKACAELVTAAYRRSFFGDGAAIASARAGNVIGGGDWAEDRVVPDLVRAAVAGEPAVLRNPGAVRPWQHVLEPLRGYLLLGERLLRDGQAVAEGWNFGPSEADAVTVQELADRLACCWDRVRAVSESGRSGPHEARYLKLDHGKARRRLGWSPILGLDRGIELTAEWYREHWRNPGSAAELVDRQIGMYTDLMKSADASAMGAA
jgi:CDP-glucose 4,6-dehydratase